MVRRLKALLTEKLCNVSVACGLFVVVEQQCLLPTKHRKTRRTTESGRRWATATNTFVQRF